MPQRPLPLALVALVLGCSATAIESPGVGVRDTATGGGTSSGGGSSASAGRSTAGSGGPGSSLAGNTSNSAGAASAAGSTNSAGSSSTGGGGSGSALGGAGGQAASAGGSSGPVTVGLPFTEDWESGSINPKLWTAVAKQLVDATNAQWSIVSNDTGKAAQLNSDSTERFLVGGSGAWTDQKVDLRVQVVSGSPEIDIAFRYHGVKEYYYLELADAHFKVRDRTSANSDLQPTSGKPAIKAGTWYKVTLQIKGTAVSASLNDMVIASGDFATMPIAAGGIAIGVGSGSGVVQFDDIHVTLP